jgi:hypothetical protein
VSWSGQGDFLKSDILSLSPQMVAGLGADPDQVMDKLHPSASHLAVCRKEDKDLNHSVPTKKKKKNS